MTSGVERGVWISSHIFNPIIYFLFDRRFDSVFDNLTGVFERRGTETMELSVAPLHFPLSLLNAMCVGVQPPTLFTEERE